MKQFLSKSAFISNLIRFGCLLMISQGCQKIPSGESQKPARGIATQDSSIIGGTQVPPTTKLAQKVFYLALGVDIKLEKGKAVSLTSTGLCTTTAIRPRVLITAAHCVFGIPSERTFVTIRKNPWGQSLDMKDWIKAKEIVMHPNYNHNDVKMGFDVALIYLERDLPSGSVTKIRTDPPPQTDFPIVSVGYGRTSVLNDFDVGDVSKLPSLLNMVERLVQNYAAQDLHFVINQKDHKGICFGDSGGPALLFDAKSNEHFILGVTSYVSVLPDEKAKADPDNKMNSCIGQGHYTNILSYIAWVNATVNDWN